MASDHEISHGGSISWTPREIGTSAHPWYLERYRLAGFQSIRTGMQTVVNEITALLAMVVGKRHPTLLKFTRQQYPGYGQE